MDLHFWFETQTKLFPEAVYLDVIYARAVGSQRVHRFVLPENDPASVLSQAKTKAEADARTHASGQHVYVLALVEPTQGQVQSEFRITVGEQDVGAIYDSEQPTNEGVIKQLLRFNSNLHREARAAFRESQAALLQECTRLSARCGELEDRNQQQVALQEELLSMRHERDLDSMRSVNAERRKERMMGKVLELAPAVLPSVARAVLGDAAPAIAQDPAISEFAKTITQEQLGRMQQLFTSEQLAALGMVFQRHGALAGAGKPADAPQATGTH